jgi:hypothetical protein
MNKLREALEEIRNKASFELAEPAGQEVACLVGICDIVDEALQAYQEWQEPGEDTHPHAALWFTYPGAGGWFPTCNSEVDDIKTMFRGLIFVIAKENQGPPSDEWLKKRMRGEEVGE